MEKRRRKMVGRLDTSNLAPKWHKTIYLDGDVIRETTHDGNFSPSPSGPDYLCFTANKAGATLRMAGTVSETYQGDDFSLEYSTDGKNWDVLEFVKGETEEGSMPCVSSTLTFNNVGDKVYFRGDNQYGTAKSDFSEDELDYMFSFCGGENTQPEDNEFSVSGDIQTIKDKTGQNKTAGCYYCLFLGGGSQGTDGVLITSAPDLTATTLTPFCYCNMFAGQFLLEHPANTPIITNSMLPSVDAEMGNFGSAFYGTYSGCTSLQEMMDMSGIVLNSTSTMQECANVFLNFIEIINDTEFDITDDNGETLNFGCGIEFPLTFDGDTLDKFAFCHPQVCLGNINGFDVLNIVCSPNDINIGGIDATSESAFYGGSGSSGFNGQAHIPTGGSVQITFTATPKEGVSFVKWQRSSDGETYTDIPNATNQTYSALFSQPTTVYYKAVFEQTNPFDEWWGLKLTMPEGGTVILRKNGSPNAVSLEVSTDAVNWQPWTLVGTDYSYTLEAGQTLCIRNTSETPVALSTGDMNYWEFRFFSKAYASGELTSLLCRENTPISISPFPYCFYSLFLQTGIITMPSLSNISAMGVRCFQQAFGACRYLEETTPIPNVNQAANAFRNCYSNCTSLKKVTLEADVISALDYLGNWLNNVSATGDFYCPAELTIPTGASGIPSGWTRHDI